MPARTTVITLALLLAVRPWVKRQFNESAASATIGAPSLVGRTAWVLQTVTTTDGRVKLAGETWSARLAEGATPVTPGHEVRVVSIQGATAFVAGTALPDRGE